MYIKLENLLPNPYQPPSRCNVDMLTAQKFGQSILEHGLLQLPVVRLSKTEGLFEVGDGWLRLSGYRWLTDHNHPEYKEMPVILRGFTDQEMADLILEANGVRNDLNPIELAWYYKKYLSDFKKVTQEEFARKHQKSQSEIANTMRLLDLPDDVQGKIISREITESHGRALLPLKDKELILRFMEDAIFEGWSVARLADKVKACLELRSPKLIPEEPKVEPITAVEKERGYDLKGQAIKPEPTQEKLITEEELENQPDDPNSCNGECDKCDDTCIKDTRRQATAETEKPSPVGRLAKETTPEPKQVISHPCKFQRDGTMCDKATCDETCDYFKNRKAAHSDAPKTTGKRKLVVQEVEGGAEVSVMAEGKFPVMKTYIGPLYSIIQQLPDFLKEANDKWEGK